jgi:ABC-type nitrate/sulfonate/bicarbonate transport system substrate-binding protein
MFKQIIILIVVVAVIIGGYFWLGRKTPEKYVGPLEKVTLGAEASLLSSSVWIADHKGYFKDEGLDVNLKKYDSDRLNFFAMIKGQK